MVHILWEENRGKNAAVEQTLESAVANSGYRGKPSKSETGPKATNTFAEAYVQQYFQFQYIYFYSRIE